MKGTVIIMSNNIHSCNCGCNSHHHNHEKASDSHSHHHHGCNCKTENITVKDITKTQIDFLHHLIEYHYLPVVQFIVKSTKEKDFESIALSPVFIIDTKDTMQDVKNIGENLKQLEEKGLITLDYDVTLDNYGYNEYYSSNLFDYFKKVVEQGKENENFLGDTADIQLGSMAPTESAICLLNESK